eukprot:TRINITY_DN6006_c0_g1_i1.p1 TRINITY_DN6006_c0_g1~~TRINITY_DN6006_c0_g1_i1.p1  ORF type:complete len:197 (-),score=24.84 TRINITY_DN6006_c0_g1_i1:304-894(-)
MSWEPYVQRLKDTPHCVEAFIGSKVDGLPWAQSMKMTQPEAMLLIKASEKPHDVTRFAMQVGLNVRGVTFPTLVELCCNYLSKNPTLYQQICEDIPEDEIRDNIQELMAINKMNDQASVFRTGVSCCGIRYSVMRVERLPPVNFLLARNSITKRYLACMMTPNATMLVGLFDNGANPAALLSGMFAMADHLMANQM